MIFGKILFTICILPFIVYDVYILILTIKSIYNIYIKKYIYKN